MRISVVLTERLETELERYKRRHGASTSSVVREALEKYLVEGRRRAAAASLKLAAARAPVDEKQARRALARLRRDRERSDRRWHGRS